MGLLYGAIAGWLDKPDAIPSKAPDNRPRGWIETQYKPKRHRGVIIEGQFNGPYYSRCWWLPMKNGKRKKERVYIGMSMSGQPQQQEAK